MKINQRYVILLSIAVFLIAFVFLYMSYAKQNSEHKSAQQNLDSANATLTSVTKDKANQGGLVRLTVS